ncbi:MAG: PDZ domain-containing protein [Candidatus Neptunochlamydia sp.]|nr:PDZ domain-containing protein [Candidatus Neptunochlamydia sp.]
MVNTSFTREPYAIVCNPKDKSSNIEFLRSKPQKPALKIGVINAGGNGFASFDDLIKKAKRKTQDLGGDFILAEDGGVDNQTVYLPGHSNCKASHGSVTAYSTGPSIITFHKPWGIFSVWVYTPSNIGIHVDDKNMITGFHLNSDADSVGIRIGDHLLGVDGFDIQDQKLLSHIMGIMPQQKVRLVLLRDSKRIEKEITALPNS